MLLDQYKDVLGLPREGIHATRIPWLDYALWDVVGTIGITWLLVFLFAEDKSWQNTLRWIVVAFALGLFLHVIFGVRTKMTTTLGVI
jgi:hypothetical protein